MFAKFRGRSLWRLGRRNYALGLLRPRNNVAISEGRLDQLLEAEITTMSMQEARSLSVRDMMDLGQRPETLAALLNEELPVRYARRISMLEALPEWQGKDSIRHVREMYIKSFKELRLCSAEGMSESGLRLTLAKIKRRHTRTNLLVQSFKEYLQQEQLTETQINDWLDQFFKLRISTNLLISQFLEIANDASQGSEADASFDPYQSFISTKCDPLKIAEHAANVIQDLCHEWYGSAPKIIVTDAGAVPFTFVPRYMFYILSELLKNAVRATVEQHSFAGGSEMVPITLVVCTGRGVTSVRISDTGGGIPVDRLPRVWSYLYTTAQPQDVPITRESVDAPTRLRHVEMSMQPGHSLLDQDEDTSQEHRILLRSPLAGLGCGLPLSRLYAEYLGGRLKLQTLPRYGTDVFVYLNSVGNCISAAGQNVPQRTRLHYIGGREHVVANAPDVFALPYTAACKLVLPHCTYIKASSYMNRQVCKDYINIDTELIHTRSKQAIAMAASCMYLQIKSNT
ncbi:PDK [Symbiodinium sp. CCMP2592]|nr:PDK [Symbiodinium sp. CCMP2592]